MSVRTITLTPKQEAGFAAALADFNKFQTQASAPLSIDDYIAQRVGGLGDDYAEGFQCGAVPVGEFVRRLTGTEIDWLKARAATDPHVAGFMAALDTAPQGKVWLYSDTVTQAKAYLVAIGFDAARAAVVFAVS